MSDTVYLNGTFLPAGEASVSVLDRGFIFGDGVYEVIPVYGGRPFRIAHHLERLNHSLNGIRINNPLDIKGWEEIIYTLIERNGGGDQSLYVQVTRGVAMRDHAFPLDATPTIFAMSTPQKHPPMMDTDQGVAAITVEDIRWQMCHIKSIALLPNILLRQQALDQGAVEAIMLRDGRVTEGAASNVFIVSAGSVATPPKSNMLLPGITRDLVVELCQANEIPCEERPIDAAELAAAGEIWLTSSTREVIPVTRLDGVPVGDGRSGVLWQRMAALYRAYQQDFRKGCVD